MIKFSIITTCFNAEKYIKETIESVLNQTEFVNSNCMLEYIIVDGNSTDNTNSIITHYQKLYPQIKHIIEKDEGLYDGLSKGFKYVTGDIMGYLNAGDFLNKSAFSVLKKVFVDANINWVTGLKIIYNEESEIIKIQIPYKFRSNLIRCGVYGKYLPFIQQESTFWRSKLLNEIDFDYFKKLKKSGDMFLWYCFAKKYDLYIVNSYLSGFKYHDNQITFRETGSTDLYLEEAKNFIKKLRIFDFYHIIIDSIPWFMGRNVSSLFQKFNSKFIDYLNYEKKWFKNDSKNKEKFFYCWICDFSKNNGEGIIANHYLSYLSIQYKIDKKNLFIKNYKSSTNLENLYKSKNLISKKLNFNDKYINPFIGILYLWYRYLKGNKVAYINFLPLWNFVLFLLLPPNTILGPITGSQHYSKDIPFHEKIFRKYLMPLQFFLSNMILLVRYKNLYFNTSNLKSILFKNVIKKSKFNFFQNLYISASKINFLDKDNDFIFYIRQYPSKGTNKIIELIKKLKENYKIITIGEKTNLKGIKEYGLISRDEVLNLCGKSKYSIISNENFYSLFCFDCLNKDVIVFFEKDLDHDKLLVDQKKAYPISLNNIEKSFTQINDTIDSIR